MINSTRSVVGLALDIALLALAPGYGREKPRITRGPAKTTQPIIIGWEVTAQAGHPGQHDPRDTSPAFDRYKDALFDLAVNDLGMNPMHVHVPCRQVDSDLDRVG